MDTSKRRRPRYMNYIPISIESAVSPSFQRSTKHCPSCFTSTTWGSSFLKLGKNSPMHREGTSMQSCVPTCQGSPVWLWFIVSDRIQPEHPSGTAQCERSDARAHAGRSTTGTLQGQAFPRQTDSHKTPKALEGLVAKSPTAWGSTFRQESCRSLNLRIRYFEGNNFTDSAEIRNTLVLNF